MSTKKLNIPIVYYYKVIAIASSLKNYRITFLINETLGLHLKNDIDLIIDDQKNAKRYSYEQQSDIETEYEFQYFLFNNKAIGKQLLPSLKGFDYVFLIKSDNVITDEIQDNIYKKLKEVQNFKILLKVEKLSPRDNKVVEKNILYKEEK